MNATSERQLGRQLAAADECPRPDLRLQRPKMMMLVKCQRSLAMISIQNTETCLNAAVLGEFTLADMKDLEQQVLHRINFQGRVNLIVDLRDMLGYTVDVAWEELKFTRSHASDFGRVALVTDSQWVAWSAWLESLFTDAEIESFADYDEALAWVEAAAAASGDAPAPKP